MGSRRKAYVAGSRDDVQVPFCEVVLDPPNEPVRLYDTSGPGSDPHAGLDPLRAAWIHERGDVEHYEGRRRQPARRRPGVVPRGAVGRRAVPGRGRRPPPAAGGRRADRHPDALRPPGRDHARDGVRRPARGLDPEFVRDEVARGPGHHPGQRQPPRDRADDHRPPLPGQDQRQHRQLGGHLVGRRGGRQAHVGHPVGRRHGHGPVDRARHPHHPRVDRPQQPGADRHRPDLPGAREGRRRARGPDLGAVPRHRRSSRPSRASTT